MIRLLALTLLACLRVLAADPRPGVVLMGRDQTATGVRVVLGIGEPVVTALAGPDGRLYSQLELEGAGSANAFGAPALPLVHYAGPVPAGRRVTVTAEERTHRNIKLNHPLWPHQQPVPKSGAAAARPLFHIDPAAYNGPRASAFQKALDGELTVQLYRQRGLDHVDVLARPFAYQADTGTVRYPAEIELQIRYTAPHLPPAAGPRLGRIRILELIPRDATDLDRLRRQGCNFERRDAGRIEIYATEAETAQLRDAGLPIRELGEQLVPDTGAPAHRTGAGLHSGGYHDYASLTAELASQSAAHPDRCRLLSIGQSTRGRELWAVKICTQTELESDRPRVRLAATLHGDEPVGTELCLRLIRLLLEDNPTDPRLANLLASTEIWILPLLNPDGLEAGTRFNAGGYDLNRCFPDGGGGGLGNPVFGPPATTLGRPPEVAAVMTFSQARPFTLAANFHTGALVVNYPYDDDGLGAVPSPSPDEDLFRALSLAYAALNPPMFASAQFPQGIVNGAAWFVIDGGLQDWHYRYLGCNEVTIELSADKRPPAAQLQTLWDQNRDALLAFIATAAWGVRGRITDAASGAPIAATVKPRSIERAAPSVTDSGAYHRMLLPGTYDLVFAAPGYATRVVSNVVVQADQPATIDTALDPAQQPREKILLATCQSLSSSLDSLRTRKEADGYEVDTVVVTNRTPAPRVRTALRERYATFPADYILLIGDTNQVPTFLDDHATDLPYALIDAGETTADFLGKDAVLGRIALASTTAIDLFARKLARLAERRSRRSIALTFVSHGSTDAEWQQAERAHDYSITNCLPTTLAATRFFRDHGSAAALAAAINAGTDAVIYSGHANETGWTRFDFGLPALASLNNAGAPTIVIGHCCLTANFALGTCFAEGWLATAGRAVAYLGATGDTFWNEDEWMQTAEFDAMRASAGLSLGRAMDHGLREVHRRSPDKARYYFTTYHILGDPTAVVFDQVQFTVDASPPSILAQPRNRSAVPGAAASFHVAAAGAPPLLYQWSHNGSPLPAATAATLTLNAVSRTDAGLYTVTICNALGTIQSDSARLRVSPVTVTSFQSGKPILIPELGSASPYPAALAVSGLTQPILGVEVVLHGLTHSFPDDLDILLVSPLGQEVLLMSDAAGGNPGLANLDLAFSDDADSPIPDTAPPATNRCQPADYSTPDRLPEPAPDRPYSTRLDTFAGLDPNGIWRLFVADDSPGDAGTIARGWTLNFSSPALALEAGTSPDRFPVLRFESEPATVYLLESRIGIADGSWGVETTVQGTGAPIELPLPTAPATQRFYRLRVQ